MATSLVLTTGCATVTEKRYVENNTFISTYPKMAIKVSPELKYVGEYRGNIFKDTQTGMRTANIERVFHIFLEKGDEGDINKGLVIATFKLSTGFHWLSESLKEPRNAVDSGEIKINGKVWPYAIWPTTNFFGPAKDFVQNHGFSPNQYFLAGVISKVIDHTQGEVLGGTKLAIYYIEDRRISGSDSAQFMDRGLKAIQFLGTQSIELKTPVLQTESTELRFPFYILIQQNDEVQEYGKLKYRVQKGDVLKVLMRKTCLDGYSECWQVQNVKTGLIGYVAAQRMRKRHFIRQNQQGLRSEKGKVTVTTNLSSVSQADIDRVRNEAEKALHNISPILGVQNDKSVNIRIVKGGICNAYGGVISLPIWHVRNKKAAIVHEVTHIIASHSNNRFFSEGLAIYFQERFGEDHAFPNFSGVSLDELARTNKKRLFPFNELSNSNDIFRGVGTEERRIAYIETGSFFSFLIETYGEQKVRALHNLVSLDYEKVYGKNLRELEKEWRNHLFSS
jgi:hypothetical protein